MLQRKKQEIVSVHKGNKLEYDIVHDLIKSGLDPYARRTGIRGKRALSERISEPADIYTRLPFCIEAKNEEKLKGFYAHWNQAVAQNVRPKEPLLVIKSNKNPKLAVMDWDEFLFLLIAAKKAGYPK